MKIPPIVLDDGQIIDVTIEELDQHQIISLANHLTRQKKHKEAYVLMQFQHKKFIEVTK